MKTITVKTMLVIESADGTTNFWRREEDNSIWYCFLGYDGVELPWLPSVHPSGEIPHYPTEIILLNI